MEDDVGGKFLFVEKNEKCVELPEMAIKLIKKQFRCCRWGAKRRVKREHTGTEDPHRRQQNFILMFEYKIKKNVRLIKLDINSYFLF
jgi:hypothetical protein